MSLWAWLTGWLHACRYSALLDELFEALPQHMTEAEPWVYETIPRIRARIELLAGAADGQWLRRALPLRPGLSAGSVAGRMQELLAVHQAVWGAGAARAPAHNTRGPANSGCTVQKTPMKKSLIVVTTQSAASPCSSARRTSTASGETASVPINTCRKPRLREESRIIYLSR